jgi:hypothetical protein
MGVFSMVRLLPVLQGLLLLILLLVTGCFGGDPAIPKGFKVTEPVEIDFVRSSRGMAPIYWSGGFSDDSRGRWITSSYNGSGAIEQIITGKSGTIPFIAYHNIAFFTNFRVQADIQVIDDPAAQGGGLLWSLQNNEDYYACYINAKIGRVSFVRKIDGGENIIKQQRIKPFKTGSTVHCIVDSIDGVTTLYVNGREVLKMNQEIRPGKVGVYTKYGVRTVTTDFKIVPLARMDD